MAHRKSGLFCAVVLLAIANNLVAYAATTASVTPPSTAENINPALDTSWAQVLDPNLPLSERQRTLAALEDKVQQSNDPHALYMLGSLYHMGQHAPSSPVQESPEKASLYFGNAAIRGSVLAMAKMAELKLAAGQYREAMNWAQIYAHYALMSKQGSEMNQAYAAELVQRVMDRMGDSQMTAIMADVNSFIAAYDTNIKVGMAGEAMLNHLHPTSARRHYKPILDERAPDSGIADFIIAFKPDGSVANVLLLDAVPRADVGAALHAYAENMTVTPAPEGNDHVLRYAWVPALLNDRRYRTTTRH